jgi:SAM-dependent methyltransferase
MKRSCNAMRPRVRCTESTYLLASRLGFGLRSRQQIVSRSRLRTRFPEGGSDTTRARESAVSYDRPLMSAEASACLVCDRPQSKGLRRGTFSYFRCAQCGLLSSVPVPTAEQIENHYKQKFLAGNYETARRHAAQYRRVHEQLADFMGGKPGDRVLDVGCFTGELLSILSSRGAEVHGLELQAEAVAIANERLPGRVYQADVFGTNFPPGPYDVVTMMGVIEHVTDPAAFVRRAYSLLRPGGRLFLQTPDSGSLIARLARAHWPPLAPVEHIHLFSRPALRELLSRCGFSDIRFRAHVKWLSVGYVYEMLRDFGPEWRRLLWPIHALLRNTLFPFYVGEMFVSAMKE